MRFPRSTALVLATAAGLGVTAPQASAVTAPYTAQEICGPGYAFVREAPIVTRHRAANRQRGLAILLHSRSRQEFCGVVIKTAGAIGTPSYVRAAMRGVGGKGPRPDAGEFRYYAGPLRMKGRRGEAVSLTGQIETARPGSPATGGF